MRMNYRIYPVDYVEELNRTGLNGAKKAMAFLSYWHCVEMGDYHSTRFHATKWGVSPSTGFTWMKEFDKEIDLFRAHWDIKKKASDSSIKKLNEQNERSQSSKQSTNTAPQHGTLQNIPEQIEQTQSSKALNKYDDNNARTYDKLFTDLFNIYNMNSNFPGSKDKAQAQYIKMCHTVKHTELIQSAVLYLHDPKREGKLNNLANFLKNEVHINYMPKYIRVFTKGEWVQGEYDRENETFTGTTGEQMKVLAEVFTRKFIKGEIEFISEVAA